MTEGTFQKVGYAVQSASGRSFKLYIGTQFVGLLSLADLERAKKSRIFVATIVKFNGATETKPNLPNGRNGEKPEKKPFYLNLLETEEWKRL
jgi:hypothetical protein